MPKQRRVRTGISRDLSKKQTKYNRLNNDKQQRQHNLLFSFMKIRKKRNT